MTEPGPARRTLLQHLLLASLWANVSCAGAGPQAAVQTITLERDCSGCAHGSALVLRGDGTATLTLTGKARRGTQDQVSQGRLASADFERLALQAQALFALDDRYEDPQLQDGAWFTVTVQRGTQTKQVLSRNGAGPAALQAFEQAVEALRARTVFVAERR